MAFKNMNQWKEKLNRSSFFFIALFLHVVVLAMVATIVIFRPTILSTPDFDKVLVPPGAPPPPPPVQQVTVAVPTVAVPVTAPAIVSDNAAPSFTIPTPDLNAVANPNAQAAVKPSAVAAPSQNNLAARLPGIMATVSHWRTRDNILNSDNDVHNVVAKFPVFLAQYANGDWNCNNYGHGPDGTILAGCLPNLVFQIGVWSKGNLRGDDVKYIAIDSPELLSNPPPYIFFTGHRDFTLTDAEIDNLRKYLQVGGCIWGDSAFAGTGSRFDVAFHREMKRVLPDADKNFETLPMSHDIFTKSWFLIDKIPTGMNYRNDPVEIINIDGKLAVIYTPNDYSDMMTMLLIAGSDPPQEDPWWPSTPDHPLFSNNRLFGDAFFFRNWTTTSCQDCFKLSMNIIAHLLIRFDKEMQLAP
jgi:hypothetical protein